jgi:hypothetical protein
MRCGNCKEKHDTKEEVWDCYQGKGKFVPATDKQLSFLNLMLEERGEVQYPLDWISPDATDPDARLSKAAASAQISILARQGKGPVGTDIHKSVQRYGCQCPPEEPCTCDPGPVREPLNFNDDPPTETIPPGYYATPSASGNNDYDFWLVKNGRKPGRQFVNRVVGGSAPIRISYAAQKKARSAILRFGIDLASKTFAEQTNSCRACRIILSEEASRVLGYGETCANKRGLGAEWRRLNLQFKARTRAEAKTQANKEEAV